MRVLHDTNVVLDVMLSRSPWEHDAEQVWRAAREGRVLPHLTSSSLTDVYYISRRFVGRDGARDVVRRCLDALTILSVGRDLLEQAYALPIVDFEDALQAVSALHAGLDAIITRDVSGFQEAGITIHSPDAFAALLRLWEHDLSSGGKEPNTI